ncbi:MAG: hypothetical protein R3F59_08920 [Myxococcota bacterium]
MSRDPILGDLLSDTRAVVSRLLEEPLREPAELRRLLDEAEEVLRHELSRQMAVADGALAERLVTRCRALLDRWEVASPRERKLVQVAVRYFVMEDDGAADLDSAFGFDDDAEVIDAVSRALGLPPLEAR